MMNDQRLSQMLHAVGEYAEIYDDSDPLTVIATPRGVFTKLFHQIDSDSAFNAQFDHTIDTAVFQVRTLDCASIRVGQRLRLKNGSFQSRPGAADATKYRIMDIRNDGHGMTGLVLHK